MGMDAKTKGAIRLILLVRALSQPASRDHSVRNGTEPQFTTFVLESRTYSTAVARTGTRAKHDGRHKQDEGYKQWKGCRSPHRTDLGRRRPCAPCSDTGKVSSDLPHFIVRGGGHKSVGITRSR